VLFFSTYDVTFGPGEIKVTGFLILVGYNILVARVYIGFFLNLGRLNQLFQYKELKLF
jgi:hypothetical protein